MSFPSNPPSSGDQDQDRDSVDRAASNPPLPPQYPISEASSSRPPPFSSLYHDPSTAQSEVHNPGPPYSLAGSSVDGTPATQPAPSYNTLTVSPFAPQGPPQLPDASERADLGTKQEPSGTNKTPAKEEDSEPPPAYSEGPSPLQSFTFVMATAGGASSIITQVQQGGPPTNTLGGEHGTCGFPTTPTNSTCSRCWGRRDDYHGSEVRTTAIPSPASLATGANPMLGVPDSSCLETSCSRFRSSFCCLYSRMDSSQRATWEGFPRAMRFKLMLVAVPSSCPFPNHSSDVYSPSSPVRPSFAPVYAGFLSRCRSVNPRFSTSGVPGWGRAEWGVKR